MRPPFLSRVLLPLRYFRLWTYQWLLKGVSPRMRQRRIRLFLQVIQPRAHERVLDLGGHPSTWANVETPLQITILNLPGAMDLLPASTGDTSRHSISYVVGDACEVQGFSLDDFDIVHSNSVIEHVGPEEKQRQFAAQVRKFGKRYWIQTPSKWFPIEAHCGMPFWWFYPESLRQRLIRGWRPKLPAWTEMVETTRVIEKQSLADFFPEAHIHTERVLGIPKSYVAWSTRAQTRAHGPDQLSL